MAVDWNSPPQGGHHSRLKEAILLQYQRNRPLNTQKAYKPKVKEWTQFCNHVYSHIPESERYLLNSENTYKFILYQAMRPKKAVGGGRKKKASVPIVATMEGTEEEDDNDAEEEEIDDESFIGVSTWGEGFNSMRYDSVMAQFTDHNIFVVGEEVRHPENPVGFQQVNTYKAALLSIHQAQVACKLIDVPFEPNIWSLNHKCLMELVKGGSSK